MARDAAGNYHMNPQLASHAGMGKPPAAGKMGGKMAPHGAGAGEGNMDSVRSITIHQHADGSHHTESDDGEHKAHPSLTHAMAHSGHHMEPEGTHMHIHSHDGGGMESSHTGEDGETQGPDEHENLEAMKSHMDVMGGEGDGDGAYGHEPGDMDMEGMDGIG